MFPKTNNKHGKIPLRLEVTAQSKNSFTSVTNFQKKFQSPARTHHTQTISKKSVRYPAHHKHTQNNLFLNEGYWRNLNEVLEGTLTCTSITV